MCVVGVVRRWETILPARYNGGPRDQHCRQKTS